MGSEKKRNKGNYGLKAQMCPGEHPGAVQFSATDVRITKRKDSLVIANLFLYSWLSEMFSVAAPHRHVLYQNSFGAGGITAH